MSSRDRAVYLISIAAEMAGMHPQTLREYDRLGIVSPSRTAGRAFLLARRIPAFSASHPASLSITLPPT